MVGNEVAVTEGPPALEGGVVRVGPFVAAGRPFVLEGNVAEVLDRLADRLRDLRAATAEGTPTVFLIARRGPSWLSHPWGLWRDGEACETTVTDSYLMSYVLWEVTRLVLESAHPLIPIHAAAVERDGRAIVLAGESHTGKSTLAGWLTAHGWGFLTDEVALLERRHGGEAPVVHPFWRPIGVRRGGPLDALITPPSPDAEVLIPASELGALGTAAPLAAIVLPHYDPGADPGMTPLAPATAVRLLATHLPTLGAIGRVVFRAIVSIVESVPAYALGVDDLDAAERAARQLVGDRATS